MQSAAIEREVTTTGLMAKASFGISQAHAAHIMGILRSTLYSRKALAVLREYGTNAWDEHRQAGKGDLPISVQLPSMMRPTLKIRDFGRGLSEHDVLHIYTQYGESTKRDTNDAAGMLGIGCKAGFAYADSFTVTSWHQGQKSVYIAVLDKSNKGEMQKVHEEPCGSETGIEIQMAVKPRDVDEFHREARGLFRYFDPQPQINMPLAALPRGMTRGFVLDEPNQGGTREWIAVMGCIPYRMDLEQLKEALTELGLWDALGHLSGGIYLPIGSVEFSASREELQYTENTVAVLVAQIQALTQEYVDDALTALSKPDVKDWDRRMKATFMHSILKFPLPKEFRVWTETAAMLFSREKGLPKTFNLVDSHKDNTSRVPVRQDSRILIWDDRTKPLKGWHLQHSNDVLAVPNDGCAFEQVKTEIEALAVTAQIVGVPIDRLSNRGYWSARDPNGKQRYPPNQKHKDRTFILADRFSDTSPRSKYWESAKPPTEEHVYIIISEFRPSTGPGLHDMTKDKYELFKTLGIAWPTIYGYKTTDAWPVKDSDIEKGISYKAWREKTVMALITDQVKDDLREIGWADLFAHMSDSYNRTHDRYKPFTVEVPALIERLTQDLGEKHPLVRYFQKHLDGRAYTAKFPKGRRDLLDRIVRAAGYTQKRDGAKEWLLRLLAAYPMLTVTVKTSGDMWVVQDHYDTIITYIKIQDAAARGSKPTPEA